MSESPTVLHLEQAADALVELNRLAFGFTGRQSKSLAIVATWLFEKAAAWRCKLPHYDAAADGSVRFNARLEYVNSTRVPLDVSAPWYTVGQSRTKCKFSELGVISTDSQPRVRNIEIIGDFPATDFSQDHDYIITFTPVKRTT